MSGDYKIELRSRRGHWYVSEDTYACQCDARCEIRRRQRLGEHDGCEVYILNDRTGWRSSEVTPRKRKADR